MGLSAFKLLRIFRGQRIRLCEGDSSRVAHVFYENRQVIAGSCSSVGGEHDRSRASVTDKSVRGKTVWCPDHVLFGE